MTLFNANVKAIRNRYVWESKLLPDKKPDVFLCHSSKDKSYVRRLACDLDVLGIEPWFDTWELSMGDSLIKRIGEGIGSSRYFCIILSLNSEGSRWCDAELSEALSISIEEGKQNVLLVKKGNVKTPSFIKDRVYIHASRYSAKLPMSIAFKIYNIDPKAIDAFFLEKKRPTLEDARMFISMSLREKSAIFGTKKWEKLRSMLREHDISIGDSIRILDVKSGRKYDAQ
jgi:hypothetical protein